MNAAMPLNSDHGRERKGPGVKLNSNSLGRSSVSMAIFSRAEKPEQSLSRRRSGVAAVAAEVVCCYTGKHSQALAITHLQTRNACGRLLLCREPQPEVVEESLV